MYQVISRGARWILGDGNSIKFWSDKWLGDDTLASQAIWPVELGDLAKSVPSFWINNQGWDWLYFDNRLPTTILLKLAVVNPDIQETLNNNSGEPHVVSGDIGWSLSQDGNYTTAFAYRIVTGSDCLHLSEGDIFKVGGDLEFKRE